MGRIDEQLIKAGDLLADFRHMTIDEVRAWQAPEPVQIWDQRVTATRYHQNYILTMHRAGIANAQQARLVYDSVFELHGEWYNVVWDAAYMSVQRLLPGGYVQANPAQHEYLLTEWGTQVWD